MFRRRRNAKPDPSIEELVNESQRLRDELIKTTVKLEIFASQLKAKAVHLSDQAHESGG